MNDGNGRTLDGNGGGATAGFAVGTTGGLGLAASGIRRGSTIDVSARSSRRGSFLASDGIGFTTTGGGVLARGYRAGAAGAGARSNKELCSSSAIA